MSDKPTTYSIAHHVPIYLSPQEAQKIISALYVKYKRYAYVMKSGNYYFVEGVNVSRRQFFNQRKLMQTIADQAGIEWEDPFADIKLDDIPIKQEVKKDHLVK
jgi:hypothetical protein